MAEAITIARPYAQAAFLFASEQHTLKDWSDMLGLLAAIADDKAMRELIHSPHMSEKQLADLFISVGGDRLNEKFTNFIRVLASNRRLEILPEIAVLFEIQRRDAEADRLDPDRLRSDAHFYRTGRPGDIIGHGQLTPERSQRHLSPGRSLT